VLLKFLIAVMLHVLSVEYAVIFLILQQAKRAASWVFAGRMLCTPVLDYIVMQYIQPRLTIYYTSYH